MEYKDLLPASKTISLLDSSTNIDNDQGEDIHDEIERTLSALIETFNYQELYKDKLFVLLMDVKNHVIVDVDNDMLYAMIYDDKTTEIQKKMILCIFLIQIERKTENILEIDKIISLMDIGISTAPEIYTNILLQLSNLYEIKYGIEVLENLCDEELIYAAKIKVLNIIINSLETETESQFLESVQSIYNNKIIREFILGANDTDESKLLILAMLSLPLPKNEIDALKELDFD